MSKVNTVTVWHANKPTWEVETSPVWEAANYTLVAVVDPDPETGEPASLDRAYFLTNHIDHAWWDNEGVSRVGPECRSTSVGDVIFRNGTPYRVASFGFDEIRKAA